ncbi:MAG: hypothetical protein MZV49_07195 [Rhodopseudomonas palustris]|nr:hypothetical protein [Rhodopseudomonas palustris]
MIISNCVINLSADKDRVLARGLPRAQAGRPLRRLRRRRRAARSRRRFAASMRALGRLRGRRARRSASTRRSSPPPASTDIAIEPTRVYSVDDAREFLAGEGPRRRRHRAVG